MTQLVLFHGDEDGDDSRPLPEIIVGDLGGEMLHIDRDGVRYYRVLDWIYEVSGSKSKQRHTPWRDLKKSIEKGGENFAPLANADEKGQSKGGEKRNAPWMSLEYQTDGGPQTSDFATDEGLYWITQHMSNRSQTVREVKAYLAKAGVFVDQIRREPESLVDATIDAYRLRGKSDGWIAERLDGMVTRKLFTEALVAAVAYELKAHHFAQATNDIYEGLWNRTALMLRREMNIPDRARLRDNMPRLALSYLNIAEETASMALGQQQEITFTQAREIVQRVAGMIGQQAQMTSRLLGIDLPTGRPLLDEGGE